MPIINKKRVDKKNLSSTREEVSTQIDEKHEKEIFAQKDVSTCSKENLPKRRLLALKRIKITDLDALAATVGGGGNRIGVRGDIGGESEGGKKGGIGERERGGEPSPSGPAFLGRLIHKAHLSFKRKQEREAKRPAPVPKIDRLWFSIVLKHFPRAVPPLWDAKHRGLAKHLAKRIGAENVVEFVKWAVEHWNIVIHLKFSWIKRYAPPATPELPFLVRFVHSFVDAREGAKDKPMEPQAFIRGVNTARKREECRNTDVLNTPPISAPKKLLLKKDLDTTVSTLPTLPSWRD